MKTPSKDDPKPDRENLGPTGPAKVQGERKDDEVKHPHAGNVVAPDDPNVGPAPTDDPRQKTHKLEKDRKPTQTPPD
jgi:hypothetical protein